MIDVCFVLDQALIQYQQNEQSPLILTELADHKKTTTGTKICGIKPVNKMPTLHSW